MIGACFRSCRAPSAAWHATPTGAPKRPRRTCRALLTYCSEEITRFEPHTIFDGGDKVFVLIAFEATVRGKGYSFPNNGHLWQFNAAGKVVKYDHVTDTAQMIRMANGK
jgi:hypothetical protein